MTDLIPIGRFAQITHLSVKALSIYAQEGLLPPNYIDAINFGVWGKRP